MGMVTAEKTVEIGRQDTKFVRLILKELAWWWRSWCCWVRSWPYWFRRSVWIAEVRESSERNREWGQIGYAYKEGLLGRRERGLIRKGRLVKTRSYRCTLRLSWVNVKKISMTERRGKEMVNWVTELDGWEDDWPTEVGTGWGPDRVTGGGWDDWYLWCRIIQLHELYWYGIDGTVFFWIWTNKLVHWNERKWRLTAPIWKRGFAFIKRAWTRGCGVCRAHRLKNDVTYVYLQSVRREKRNRL